jgi:predicted HAD superfamily hydrolase
MNTSDKILLASFESNFSTLRDSNVPIALYGIGIKTQLLLENIKDYNIVGLMDKDTVGSYVYGQLVLSYEEVINKVKLIVIVANFAVTDIIYQRISFLKEYGISILRINGTEPANSEEEWQDSSYFNNDYKSLINLIDEHDVISFDLFDTLIMRRVLLPPDIFDLVEVALIKKFGSNFDFKAKRIKAEYSCYNEIGEFFNIFEVYSELKKQSDISAKLADEMFEMELFFESENCVPRKAIVSAMEYAFNHGKHVCITTDTYLKKEHILSLIQHSGIISYNELHISCELQKSKSSSSMWQYFKEKYDGNKVLHIGDNFVSDIENAKNAGISTFEVKNALDLVTVSSLNYIRQYSDIIDNRLMLGQLFSFILNDPFVFYQTKGALKLNTMYDLGYLSFGPLVLNYLLWLIRTSKELKTEKLLFFARDGYLLEQLYKQIVYSLGIDAPASQYFYTSRRAASVAAIFSNEDIAFVINQICNIKKATVEQMLCAAFGISPNKGDVFNKQSFFEISKPHIIEHIVKNYSEQVLENALSERENYHKYIHSLGLTATDKIGCVNYVGRGVTQRCVSKLMGAEIHGYYFATESDMQEIIPSLENVSALYGNLTSPHTESSAFVAKFLFGEVIFSSPDEQVVKFDKSGSPEFQNSKKVRNFSKVMECHRGIADFVEGMLQLDPLMLSRSFNVKMVESFYGLFSSKHCLLSDGVKSSFTFSDYYDPNHSDICLF